MKPLTMLALALSVLTAGCDEVLAPAAPTGEVTLVSQVSASQVLPAVNPPETAAVGGISISMIPAASGGYTATFTIQLSGFVSAGLIPQLPDGSVIVAGLIYQGAAGSVGAPVLQLPIGATPANPPVYTPTGTALMTISNVAVPAAVAGAILASPSSFYFQLHSAVNQFGVVRGQLIMP